MLFPSNQEIVSLSIINVKIYFSGTYYKIEYIYHYVSTSAGLTVHHMKWNCRLSNFISDEQCDNDQLCKIKILLAVYQGKFNKNTLETKKTESNVVTFLHTIYLWSVIEPGKDSLPKSLGIISLQLNYCSQIIKRIKEV
jgi:hypothetical protein